MTDGPRPGGRLPRGLSPTGRAATGGDARTLRTGERQLATALGSAVEGLVARSSSSGRVAALWGRAAGPIGVRHTRGLYLKEPGRPGGLPTLYVYLDGSAFVYEYATDHLLYESRLAYLGLSVERIEFHLSSSAGRPRSPRTAEGKPAWEAERPAARPLSECPPLDADTERWARRAVEPLPPQLADALYGAMTSTLRRNRDDRAR